jgi:hypothetical protein
MKSLRGKTAEYHVFRILLTFIAASCGELNPGEIKLTERSDILILQSSINIETGPLQLRIYRTGRFQIAFIEYNTSGSEFFNS